MPTVPCKGCKDRRPGCHSCCEQYAAFRARMDKAIERRAAELDVNAMTVNAIDRMKKLRKRRN